VNAASAAGVSRFSVLSVLAVTILSLLVGGVHGYLRHLNSPVEDNAAVMDASGVKRLTTYRKAILDAYDIDLRIITIAGGEDVNLFAARKFEAMKVGSQSDAGRGALFVVDTASDQVRLEVGRSLEGVYTDAFVKYIEERQMVPFFQADRVTDGILATIELIAGRARDAVAGKAFDLAGVTGFEKSTGAGAVSKARIGAGYRRPGTGDEPDVAASGKPLSVVDAYHRAMEAGNARPDLDIYTPATRQMMADWVVTPAQMRNMVREYGNCPKREEKIRGDHAVVRYGVRQRQCSPYFLQRGQDGVWRLDLTQMSNAIRFNHRNEWHFAGSIPRGYAFAFDDWRFDEHGFPHPGRAPNND
jgi:uncharacterized protein